MSDLVPTVLRAFPTLFAGALTRYVGRGISERGR